MEAFFPKVVAERDPMALVDAARARGDEVRMVTGHDPAGDSYVVAWHIVPTNQYVIEGVHHGR